MRNQGEAGTLYVADEWRMTHDVMTSRPDFHIWVAAGQLALFENLTGFPLVLEVHTILNSYLLLTKDDQKYEDVDCG